MSFDYGTVMNMNDIAQVAILYFTIYGILKSAKGSRFGQALLGVGVLAALAALFTFVFHFDVLSQIVRWMLMYLALSTVVIFQPEIRRMLTAVGALGTFERTKYSTDGAAEPDFVVETVMKLADLKMAGTKFVAKKNPWQTVAKYECAFPCSRQNELDGKDAAFMLKNGVKLVGEGANMPCTPDAANAFIAAKILYSPGKASNAGGVATSGLEMSQNSERISWTREQVDSRLKGIMKAIHDNAWEAAAKYGKKGNYVAGANIAGFTKVADAMVAQGVC